MLMSILVGSLEASGQSARKAENRESTRKSAPAVKRETRESVSKAHPSSAREARSSSHGKAVVSSRNQRTNQAGSVRQNAVRNTRPTHKHVAQPSRGNARSNRTISTTTRNNPKSDYGYSNRSEHMGKTYKNPRGVAPNGNVHARNGHSKTYGNTQTYGHARTVYQEHRYYPKSRVNIHVYPKMHRGHYKVLYYPRYSEIVWTSSMYRYYADIYPGYAWHYNRGYRIQTMSVFDARYNVGEIARVYGRVYGTWYNRDTDDLLLFFGGEFPYQEFTLVMPGKVARRYAWRPERYFLGQHIVATGLITTYEGKPEMVVKRKRQLDVY